MSKPVFFNSKVVYHDNSREYNIDARGRDLSEVIRTIDTQDVVPVQEEKPESKSEHFPYLTQKCFDEKRVSTIEAEIQAARKGTAEDMWRTLWNNENLGYVAVQYINATTLYREIEKWYGELPYKERNFREARNKR
ncbi:MAG: hypothetical protein IJP76_08865 [Paludibacteraceae bacterium]|nr:hypothetical protein [Paludibacteraceae bacterium]